MRPQRCARVDLFFAPPMRLTTVVLLTIAQLAFAGHDARAQHAPLPQDRREVPPPETKLRVAPSFTLFSMDSLPYLDKTWSGAQGGIGAYPNPPDPHGAIGPRGVLQTTNSGITYRTKAGGQLWTSSLAGLFSEYETPGVLVDPKAMFDPVTHRFYAIAIQAHYVGTNSSLSSYVHIAVSKNSHPQSSGSADWHAYRIDVTEPSGGVNYGIDYPGLGFDGNAIYVTGNMFSMPFDGSEAFRNVQIIVIDKSDALAGTLTSAAVFTPNSGTHDYDRAFTLQPATIVGSSNPDTVAYFAECVFTGASDRIRLWALDGPLGSRVLHDTTITVANYGSPGSAPQCSTSTYRINTLGRRAQGNTFWRDGSLWFVHTGAISSHASVFWYRLATSGYPAGAASVAESGAIDPGTGAWTFQPAIGCNAQGDVAIVYTQTDENTCPTIMFTTRKAGNAAFSTPAVLKVSPSWKIDNGSLVKWGDFGSVAADPTDDGLWVTHEWATGHSDDGEWGTQWGHLRFAVQEDGWPSEGRAVRSGQTDVRAAAVAHVESGDVIVVWRENRDGRWRLFAQRLTASGAIAANWPPNGVLVTGPAAGVEPSAPQVLADGTGGVFVLWAFEGFSGPLRLQRISGSGARASGWPEDGLVLATSSLSPAMIRDGSDGVVVAWQQQGIKVQRVDASGSIQWGSGGISLASTGGAPAICPDGAGGAIVTWVPLRAQRVDSNGTPQWTSGGVSLGTGISPRVIADGSGGAVIAYQKMQGDGTADLYALRVTGSGALASGWPASGLAVSTATYDQVEQALVSDGAGGAVIVWTDSRNGDSGDPGDIYAQRVVGGGSVASGWPTGGLALCAASGQQSVPALVSDGNGGAVITWRDQRGAPSCSPPGCGDDIYAMHVLATGLLDGTYSTNGNAVAVADGDQAIPAVVVTRADTAVVSWQDGRVYGDCDPYCSQAIYAQRFRFDATPPATVTDLSAGTGRYNMVASWTWPGDDGATGAASEYDLRWSTSPISASNFESANQNTGTPGTAGTTACVEIDGLSGCTTYYLAVKHRDSEGNVSSISNLPSVKTKCSGNTLVTCIGEFANRGVNEEGLPRKLEFASPQPNPTSGLVRFAFGVPANLAGLPMQLHVFDLQGRRIAEVRGGSAVPGWQSAAWNLSARDGQTVRSGVYYARLELGDVVLTQTFVVR